MNKNLPVEIWGMIEVERRKAFRRRVEEFEDKFEYSVGSWFVKYTLYRARRREFKSRVKEFEEIFDLVRSARSAR